MEVSSYMDASIVLNMEEDLRVTTARIEERQRQHGEAQKALQENFTNFMEEMRQFVKMERNDHMKMNSLFEMKDDMRTLVGMVGDISKVVESYREASFFKRFFYKFLIEGSKLTAAVTTILGGYYVVRKIFGI